MLSAMLLGGAGSWSGNVVAQPVPVAPMENWDGMAEIIASGDPIDLHLRIGYERAVVFPEPVSLLDRSPLPLTGVRIDAEVAVFSPGGAFENEELIFIADATGQRYRFAVSASRYGSRVPMRLTVP